MTKKTYSFTITLEGTGKTIEEAWMDALVEFHSDPGEVDDRNHGRCHHVELIEEEEDSEEERESEQLRRDEKNGLYPGRWDDAN